jgi:2-dehydropantoate 2-reductase
VSRRQLAPIKRAEANLYPHPIEGGHVLNAPLYVVGAGGIGCAIGYALGLSSVPVTIIDANPEKVRWGQVNGVGIHQFSPQRASFAHFDQWQPPPQATILLCTKCYDNAAVLSKLPAGATLIPIQNGFDPELTAGPDDVECIASFVSECHPQRTVTRITRNGTLHVGPCQGGSSRTAKARQQELAGLLRKAPFRVRLVEDIRPFKYAKLMYNAAISPLAAAAGLDNGQLLSVRLARRLFFALLRENYDILSAAGVALGRVGPLHPRTVERILRRPVIANLAAVFFYPTLRGSYCSMSGDLPRGRTEIEYYNRHLMDLAARSNRPCPLNRGAYELVKTMERERMKPAPHWLSKLEAFQEKCP